ncbi:sigma-54-dependent transcriptional regulator [Pontibacter akesuensis]|uniref:DNA-binding transcriptional response regulator, NtrC family, contains REC, AAA-type ATPase, and a Fis-type DNA-binding domains n=1 Tax=Pontibacter akesuensis TaxID=388950 RepID=A0A1I7G770_9BACT|nr:sigma-54 dependent transcriptional regulator [Pontibacter akesuensis]GHA58401.1 acetoacetate metabolism regulatory protein AtoC [Pontibacter akesuensis]SFU44300.1 DNA-binding transcriptional response regulator, NtrC family, contains REC, AAA-type ATPase, and a Fis-type DNA-binding domains [Pontibacter akesuensis]
MKNTPFKIFILDDDIWYSELLEYNLSLNPDYELKKYHSAKDCLGNMHQRPNVVTLDYSLPDKNGAEVLKKIKEQNPDTQVVVISGQEDVATAVELLKLGAYDYIVKDEDTPERLWNTINKIRENVSLRQEIAHLREEIGLKYDFSNFILGNSDVMKKVFTMMDKAAKTNITVSITGETGTGKELVAKAIHYNSSRKKLPYVAVNVAAIPKELIESELFGHEKGAFTGAASRRLGRFEEAHKGTIFLDEIGELDISLQAKLLRVLQEKEITRVGGNSIVPVDVRIVVATHKNLAEEVKNGNFREDLYYRLLGLPIQLPPLRERGADIIVLAKSFVDAFASVNSIGKKTFTADAQQKLLSYNYPGNVRELRAVVELAVVMSEDDKIKSSDINLNTTSNNSDFLAQERTLKEYSTEIIQRYLDKYEGNVLLVADKLNIGKSTIYRMIQNQELKIS